MSPQSHPEPDPKTSQDYFNDIAAKYERMTSGATRHVAKYLITILPPVIPESVILDNACGTGIVCRELFSSLPADQPHPKIEAVDVAPAMISYIQAQIDMDPESWSNVTASIMPAEALSFRDSTFSHSITNFGILFFSDGAKAACEIYRTLRPHGVALVTTWADLGVWEAWQATELRIRPEQPPYQFPISKDWQSPDTLKNVMQDAGFEDVKVHQVESMRIEKDVKTLVENFAMSFMVPVALWTEDEKAKLIEVLTGEIIKDPRFYADAQTGNVGVRMLANVAIATK